MTQRVTPRRSRCVVLAAGSPLLSHTPEIARLCCCEPCLETRAPPQSTPGPGTIVAVQDPLETGKRSLRANNSSSLVVCCEFGSYGREKQPQVSLDDDETWDESESVPPATVVRQREYDQQAEEASFSEGRVATSDMAPFVREHSPTYPTGCQQQPAVEDDPVEEDERDKVAA